MSALPRLPRPWLQAYPDGLPAEVSQRHAEMLTMWRATVAEAATREAIRYFDGVITYGELDHSADAFAAWLGDQGVGRGDRVGVILQNVPHAVIAILAAWKLAAIPVPGNPMYRAQELSKVFADYGPAAVVCHDDHVAVVTEALADIGRTIPVATVKARDFQHTDDHRLLPPGPETAVAEASDFLHICRRGAGQRPPEAALTGEDLGLILYTSGTTGQPKGAMISHASLAFNIENSIAWMQLHRGSRILGLAPIFHITGFVLHMGVAIGAGCSLALHYRVHPEAVLDVVRAYRPTFTIAAITAFNALMNTPSATAEDFACFEAAFTGGAPVAPALRKAVQERLGLDLHPVYGMTESCSPTHIAPLGCDPPVDPASGALSVGLPISSTAARIAGPNGAPLPAGELGEIWMRGPQIMRGYWGKPDETARTLEDGWLKSGDIGCMDEAGWFYVVDRQKDMINVSGFKVWPREVEDVLLEHDAVREAAVVGVPDAYRGETVKAYVSLRPGQETSEPALIAHCRARLAAYKAPRGIAIIDELPKTLTGKIQRAVLRDAAASAE
jgi:long-chain acyl-CoA synthetase